MDLGTQVRLLAWWMEGLKGGRTDDVMVQKGGGGLSCLHHR